MRKEIVIVFVIGAFVLAYVMDALSKGFDIRLTTPYHYIDLNIISQYPFTTASVILKAFGIVTIPLLVLSALGIKKIAAAGAVFVVSGLLQLYALQDVATGAFLVPLEWSVAFAVAGIVLLLPMAAYLFGSIFDGSSNSTL